MVLYVYGSIRLDLFWAILVGILYIYYEELLQPHGFSTLKVEGDDEVHHLLVIYI